MRRVISQEKVFLSLWPQFRCRCLDLSLSSLYSPLSLAIVFWELNTSTVHVYCIRHTTQFKEEESRSLYLTMNDFTLAVQSVHLPHLKCNHENDSPYFIWKLFTSSSNFESNLLLFFIFLSPTLCESSEDNGSCFWSEMTAEMYFMMIPILCTGKVSVNLKMCLLMEMLLQIKLLFMSCLLLLQSLTSRSKRFVKRWTRQLFFSI